MTLSMPIVAYGALCYAVLGSRSDHRDGADNQARFALYETLNDARTKGAVRVHAFAWVQDHLHVAFEVCRTSPADFISQLATDTFARSSRSVMFEDYRLVLLDGPFSLLTLTCHVHSLPVVAGLTTDVAEYASSSFRTYLALETIPWLTTRRVLTMLDRDVDEARRVLHACVLARTARMRGCSDASACDGLPTSSGPFAGKLMPATSGRTRAPSPVLQPACTFEEIDAELDRLMQPWESESFN